MRPGLEMTRRGVAGLALGTLLAGRAARAESEPVSGRVSLTQRQVSLFGSVAWGSGTLTFHGRSYRFRIRGLGVGGVGISEITAQGEVYRLARVADFPGLYGLVRTGAVAGSSQMEGGIWLQNPAGVQMHLHTQRSGVALSVGADGMLIEMD